MTDDKHQKIYEGAKGFTNAIREMCGGDDKMAIGVFYTYQDPDTKEWISGADGVADYITRLGMLAAHEQEVKLHMPGDEMDEEEYRF